MGKGKTNNPAGRPKGTPNRITGDLRDRLAGFINSQWPTVERDLKKVSPAERLRFFERLLPYVVPRLQTLEYKTEGEHALNNLTPEQIEELYNRLTEKRDDN